MLLFLVKKMSTSITVWAGALSWCKIHNSVYRIPYDTPRHCSRKRAEGKTFAFYWTWRAFFGLGSSGHFHRGDVLWLQRFVTCYNLLGCHICLKISNFGTAFAAAHFMSETSVKMWWHVANDMPMLIDSDSTITHNLFL